MTQHQQEEDAVMTEATPSQQAEAMMDSSLPDNLKEEAQNTGITLIAKFGKERITLAQLSPESTIAQIKDLLQQETRILPKRQKRKYCTV